MDGLAFGTAAHRWEKEVADEAWMHPVVLATRQAYTLHLDARQTRVQFQEATCRRGDSTDGSVLSRRDGTVVTLATPTGRDLTWHDLTWPALTWPDLTWPVLGRTGQDRTGPVAVLVWMTMTMARMSVVTGSHWPSSKAQDVARHTMPSVTLCILDVPAVSRGTTGSQCEGSNCGASVSRPLAEVRRYPCLTAFTAARLSTTLHPRANATRHRARRQRPRATEPPRRCLARRVGQNVTYPQACSVQPRALVSCRHNQVTFSNL